jgi:methylated-DNA-[protein]-cysteine S-methyltransferase
MTTILEGGPMLYTTVDSPLGELLLLGDGDALHRISMQEATPLRIDPDWKRSRAALKPVAKQLAEYFAGKRRVFDVPLAETGTPFQRQVWEAVRAIGYGETSTYRELAARVGRPSAVRAVGAANGRNPIPVIVPCHRVIGGGGALTGYGGGVERKRLLLELEAG